MSDPYEIKKAKINSLVMAFTNSGYKSSNRIGQIELLQFLSKLTNSGNFDHLLADKLFQVLSLDHMSTMSVEDFINGYLQFEDDLRRNAEIFNIKLNQEQEIYANLVEQCRRYKSEKLNSEGLCENAKVYGEITDIDIKRKLEGIKEIIIKVIYNDKFEELHFKIGDINSNEMLNKSFGFKPTSRKDHFEFIMKGVNDRNQVFDIGSKVFSLTDINSYEEYIVQIVVPEIENEEEIAAYINAKIVLYWSDYKYYDRLRRKAESRLKKLIAATNKATQYLRYIREIYGDLTRKKSDLIVDFNNEKLMQRKGGKLKVHFNNQKEAESTAGGNYLVEFNNLREVQKTIEPAKVEITKSKQVVMEKKTVKEEQVPQIQSVQNQQIRKVEASTTVNQQQTLPVIQKVQEEQTVIRQNAAPFISRVEEESNIQNVQYVNALPPQQANYSYMQQTQTQEETSNYLQNGGQGYNLSGYNISDGGAMATTMTTETTNNYISSQDNGMGMRLAETVGYGSSDTMGNVEAYGTGGVEYIDNNQDQSAYGNAQIVNQNEIHNSINRTMVSQSTSKPVFTTATLPVKVLEAKVNDVIYDKNVRTLPVIYGTGNQVSQSAPMTQTYSYQNTVYTSNSNL